MAFDYSKDLQRQRLEQTGYTEREIETLLSTPRRAAQYEDSQPSDVPVPESFTPQQTEAAIKANFAIDNPEAALVHEAAQQNAWEREQYGNYIDKQNALLGLGTGIYDQAGKDATAANLAITTELDKRWNEQRGETDFGDFVGPAESDPLARTAQHMAAGEYARRAQGGFTGVEKAQQEINRRMQERNLRSQREAHMRGLQMRGARNSGMEVAQMLGAQQNTAERQMMQDMMNEANAQQRADRALDSGTALVSDMRGQSFGESSFNKGFEQQYNQNQARFVQDEKRRIASGDAAMAGAAAGTVADAYTHATAPVNFAANTLSGQAVGQPGSAFADATKTMIGVNQADKAAASLNDDDPILALPGIGKIF